MPGTAAPDRVLMVNKFHYPRGGAEHYMFRLAGLLEQRPGAHHVGLDERARRVDRAVDVRLRGEIHDRADTVLRQQSFQQRLVADIALHEHVARVAIQRPQVLAVAGVGQLVQDHDLRCGPAIEREAHEIGAYEAGPSRYQQPHRIPTLLWSPSISL